jgi:cbb3-type cytochrome oxidase subunit 3
MSILVAVGVAVLCIGVLAYVWWVLCQQEKYNMHRSQKISRRGSR